MGIFDGIMLLSDMDGTLLKDAKISVSHMDALRYFTENGGTFCVATGRSKAFLKENFSFLPIKRHAIVQNGTAIYDFSSEKYAWYKAVDRKVLDRALELIGRFPETLRIIVHTLEQTVIYDGSEPNLASKLAAIEGEILKIVLISPTEVCSKMQKYCENFTDFQYSRSCDMLLELLDLEAGKGVCLDKLRVLHPEINCFVGVGDYQNDVSLLQAADIGVAVESNYLPIRKYADWIAPPIDEHPITWVVQKLENKGNI